MEALMPLVAVWQPTKVTTIVKSLFEYAFLSINLTSS